MYGVFGRVMECEVDDPSEEPSRVGCRVGCRLCRGLFAWIVEYFRGSASSVCIWLILLALPFYL